MGTEVSSQMDLVSGITSFIDGLVHFLEMSASDPLSYSVIFLIYAVLAAIILPIPVEIGLFFSPETPVIVKILIMGLGKMIGAIVVYYVGLTVGDTIRVWSSRFRFFNWIFIKCEWLVSKFRYVGLYIILAIPLMTDTVPLYLFSVFNEKGVFTMKGFAVVSFLGGMTRGIIVFGVFALLGVKLV
jgi:hypothetical protein